MIPGGRTNKSIKIFSNIICKKRGNYRLDRCFASNTSEDMLQPINKYKKKIKKKKKKKHTYTHTLNTKKWVKVDWSGPIWTENTLLM